MEGSWVSTVGERTEGQLVLTLDRLAHIQEYERDRCPALRHGNLEQGADNPAGVLRDVAGVGDEGEIFDVGTRDVRLEKDVDLSGTRLRAALDLARARCLDELLQLVDLVLADLDLLELDAGRDEREDVGLAHPRTEHLVEDLDTRVADVVASSDAAEVGRGASAEVAVERDHLALDEPLGGIVNERVPLAAEQRILLDLGGGHAVHERVLAHSDEQVRVAEPADTLVHVRDGSETDLGVERVGKTGREPEKSDPDQLCLRFVLFRMLTLIQSDVAA